jgi:hypothetical protein
MLATPRNHHHHLLLLNVLRGAAATVAATAAAALLCTPATADTLSGTSTVKAGGQATLEASLAEPRATCRLTLPPHNTISTVHPTRERIRWSWAVPRVTRSATWRMSVRCDAKTISYTIRVRGRAHAKAKRLYQGRIKVQRLGPPLTDTETTSAPENVPTQGNASMFALTYGQCTDWAYLKRPDIYDKRAANDPLENWSAWTWAEHGRAEGLSVDSAPRVGDIAVWPQSIGIPGHVAYIEAVQPQPPERLAPLPGQSPGESPGVRERGPIVTVSQMNAAGLPAADYRPNGAGGVYAISTFDTTGMGLEYIHQR